jgi:hypothetical protein
MKKEIIYTIEHIRKEAELISGYWNGSDEKYVDGNGDVRTEDDVNAAQELLEKIGEVEKLCEELGI